MFVLPVNLRMGLLLLTGRGRVYYSHSILADDVDNAAALVLVPLMHIKCNFLRGPFYGVIRLAALNGKYKHGKLAKNACDRNFKSLNAK